MAYTHTFAFDGSFNERVNGSFDAMDIICGITALQNRIVELEADNKSLIDERDEALTEVARLKREAGE